MTNTAAITRRALAWLLVLLSILLLLNGHHAIERIIDRRRGIVVKSWQLLVSAFQRLIALRRGTVPQNRRADDQQQQQRHRRDQLSRRDEECRCPRLVGAFDHH